MSEVTEAVDRIVKSLIPTVHHDLEPTLDLFLNDEDEGWITDSVNYADLRIVIRAALGLDGSADRIIWEHRPGV